MSPRNYIRIAAGVILLIAVLVLFNRTHVDLSSTDRVMCGNALFSQGGSVCSDALSTKRIIGGLLALVGIVAWCGSYWVTTAAKPRPATH